MLLIQGKSPAPEVHFRGRRDYSSSKSDSLLCMDCGVEVTILNRRHFRFLKHGRWG